MDINHQTLLSVGFSGKNTGVACHFLLQGIFLTQGSNLGLFSLLHCKCILYPLRHWESPRIYWVAPNGSSGCAGSQALNSLMTLIILLAVLSSSVVTLCDPRDCSLPGSSVHGILQQEYGSGLPCPPEGDLPDPGIKPRFPTLQADSLPSEPPGKPNAAGSVICICQFYKIVVSYNYQICN